MKRKVSAIPYTSSQLNSPQTQAYCLGVQCATSQHLDQEVNLQHFDSNCVFCRELRGQRDTNFAVRYPELTSRIIARTSSLVAFPCIGQIAPGHFLVVPRRHYRTFSEASRFIPDLFEEFVSILTHVNYLFNYNPVSSLIFEHGALAPSDGGCGIYHAHIHIVPESGHIDLSSHIPFNSTDIFTSVEKIWSSIDSGRSYLAYGSCGLGYHALNLDKELPSQYLRKIVAGILGNDNWDWRKHGREAGLLESIINIAS